jgi:predicted anti-sigma-YlaC factor YlaD
MSEPICEETRRKLALGEADAGVRGHLAACEACRLEARRVEAVLGLLAEEAEVEPAREVDQRVRELILGAPPRPRWALNPAVATALAAGSLLALVSAAAGALAQGAAGGLGLAPAVLAVTAYLAFSSAATLPLLLLRRARAPRVNREVRP